MDARVVQEAAGPGRFLLGFGTSKIFLNNTKQQTNRTLGPMRDAVAIVKGVLSGEAFQYDGGTWSADVPALNGAAHTPREVPPVYVAATAPKMQALAGEIGDGCLTPSITTPAFVRYTRENVARDIDIGCTVVASIGEDRDEGRDGAREIAGMYLANKVQNIQGSADTLLELAGIEQEEIRPVAEAMERGGRLAAKDQVTDELLDKCKPIAGTPEDCIAAIEEYREAGCTHVMLELWGDRRHDQIRMFGEQVLPQVPMIDERRLVDLALRLVSTPSFTGSEEACARVMARELEELGLEVMWQQVEDGRANVVGTWPGEGGGPTLMFNGHLDTSYSGEEPWLRDIPGFRPEGFERDGRIYGLGISNMKGALACYVEAVRSLIEDGVRLKGDVLVAAVAGEIEKTQEGDAQGAEYRGYAAGSRHLVGHGGAADLCILGEPTENKLVLAHFGTLWLRLRVTGPFVHTAFSMGRIEENSIVRMRPVLDRVLAWLPEWEEEMSYGDVRGVANVGAIQGGFGWRVSRTPHATDLFVDLRVPPDVPMADARRRALEFARGLEGVEAEVYVTAPGAEIDEGSPVVGAVAEAHEEVFGSAPERDVTRWFSDASVLSRYGIATLNYGTSSGLPDAELGENLEIEGLVKTADVYARAAQKVCG